MKREFTLESNDETGASIVGCFLGCIVFSILLITVIAIILLLIRRIL